MQKHQSEGRRAKDVKFREEAQYRVNNILRELDQLEKLSDARTNQFSKAEVEAVFLAILERAAQVAKSFEEPNHQAFRMPRPEPVSEPA